MRTTNAHVVTQTQDLKGKTLTSEDDTGKHAASVLGENQQQAVRRSVPTSSR